MFKNKIYIIVLISLSIAIIGCAKKEQTYDLKVTRENVVCLNVITDIFEQVDYAVKDTLLLATEGSNAIVTGYSSLSINPVGNSYPKKIQIDYSNDFVSYEGNRRGGTIQLNIIGRYRKWWLCDSIYCKNFVFNAYTVNGLLILTNNGYNANGNLTYKLNIKDLDIVSDIKTTIFKANLDFIWDTGINTDWPNFWDDSYKIFGTYVGYSNQTEQYFDGKIINPLIYLFTHYSPVVGTLDIIHSKEAKRTLDFGNGVWDDSAKVYVNDKVIDIALH